MDARFSAYAAVNAPRYTSYPTAPQFSATIGPEQQAQWLRQLEPGDPISLYIHVPFCREICWYCGCNTKGVRRDDILAEYVETLVSELALTASLTGPLKAHRLHWGGGTPHSLGPDALSLIHNSLSQHFDLSALNEHAIEIDPRTLTEGHVRALAAAGVTRASLGVQDLNDHVQRAIGRIQPFATVETAVLRLRDAGIRSISFDLMYGLPQQSLGDVQRSVSMALALRPDRFSIFGYAHVPWMKARQRLIDETRLPDTALRAAQEDAVRDLLVAAGYQAIGLDHFALPADSLAIAAREGRLRRNFQGYVDDDCATLVGYGPSAISRLPAGFIQNANDSVAWSRAIAGRNLAGARGYAMTTEDLRRGAIIEQLMCRYVVNLADFGGASLFPEALDYLAPLLADGFVRRDGDMLQVETEARGLVRLVAYAFDAYRDVSAARYSRVV